MRKEFPRRVKALAFKRCCDAAGIPHCQGCGIIITAGNLFFDHIQPDGLGGEPILENCQILCKTCHGSKTLGEDNPIMQKADRVMKKTYGIASRRGRPIPGSKASGLKKGFDGVVRRR